MNLSKQTENAFRFHSELQNKTTTKKCHTFNDNPETKTHNHNPHTEILDTTIRNEFSSQKQQQQPTNWFLSETKMSAQISESFEGTDCFCHHFNQKSLMG